MMYRITVDGMGTVYSSNDFPQAQRKYEYYVSLGGNVTLYWKRRNGTEEVLSYSKEH